MKRIVIILVIILISSFSIEAQQINKKNAKVKTKNLFQDSTKVQSTSSDSCCNNKNESCKNQKGNGQCRLKDKFIDKDGDGINDNRRKGMGLGCQKRKRNCGGNK